MNINKSIWLCLAVCTVTLGNRSSVCSANNSATSGIPSQYLESAVGDVLIGIEFLEPSFCGEGKIRHGIAAATGCKDRRRFRLQLFVAGAKRPRPAPKNTKLFAFEINRMLEGKTRAQFSYASSAVSHTSYSNGKFRYFLTRKCNTTAVDSSPSGYWSVSCRRGREVVTIWLASTA